MRAHLQMLPRLQARESLIAMQRVGVGTGSFGKSGADIVRGWMRSARPEQPAERVSARSAGALAAMGIRMRKLPRR